MKKRRTPVVFQLNAVECGAACLAMILGYFGRKTRLEECREKCDPGRDGVSALTILTAAREFGLRTRALSLAAGDCAAVPMPCIVYWQDKHFIVLEKWSRERVTVVDPAWGRRQLSKSDFEDGFSGIALQFEAGPDFDLRPAQRENLALDCMRRIWRTAGTARMVGQILAATLLLQAFGFALPLLTRWVIDDVLTVRTPGAIDVLCVGAVVVALTTGCVSYIRAALLIRLERQVDSNLMAGFFQHLLSLPYRFFQQRSSGDLLMRLASNSAVREALASHTTSALLDGVLVIIFLIALVRVSPAIALAACAIALVQIAVLLATARRLHCLVQSDIVSQSESQSCLIESLAGIETLKASGAERATFTRWSALLEKQLDTSMQRGRYMAKLEAAITTLRTFTPLFLLALGGATVVKGSMTLGTMIATNALAAAFLQPVASLVMSAQRLQTASAHLERIADVMRAQPEQGSQIVSPALHLGGRIEVRNVSFRYDSHSCNVLEYFLRHLSGRRWRWWDEPVPARVRWPALLGLYMPTEGEIFYDGVPARQMNPQALSDCWGTVMQDAVLFSSSVRDNITFHGTSLPPADVERAAEIAEIHAEISRMPMRYETRIDEGAVVCQAVNDSGWQSRAQWRTGRIYCC
jgi:ABC-type bacteriocin/lantibiotic exporter with double-glycine peptidase domain